MMFAGGKYPVICVVLFNPANGTCFASAPTRTLAWRWSEPSPNCLQGRSLVDPDVTPPTFDDEERRAREPETHFIDSSEMIPRDMFKRTPTIHR